MLAKVFFDVLKQITQKKTYICCSPTFILLIRLNLHFSHRHIFRRVGRDALLAKKAKIFGIIEETLS